jgi:hypothetical protein
MFSWAFVVHDPAGAIENHPKDLHLSLCAVFGPAAPPGAPENSGFLHIGHFACGGSKLPERAQAMLEAALIHQNMRQARIT